jgi:two-component system CitB family response regulator
VIRVLVVEDDFRVAQIHLDFTKRVSGFTVVGTANTAAAARAQVREHAPDLLLLDTYLPDESGLDLLAELHTDSIMVTAAADTASIRASFARGALNYLIKPFTAEQLAERLTAYARYRAMLHGDRTVDQYDIDRAMRALHAGDRTTSSKGQSPVTIRLVAEALRAARAPRTAAEIATELGIARATAQRYLAALAQSGTAEMRLRYGSGRPEHLYIWHDH